MMHPDTELLMHLASNLVREYPNGVSTIDMHLRMAISLDKTRKILCFARKARMLDDGLTLEVTRTCTDGTRNANSKLYGAICRAATALGYAKCVTYTQHDESGASLRGAGWAVAAQLPARKGWDAPSRKRSDIGSADVARIRWERVL